MKRAKIAEGKAHELSEGDTFYLGACTKGANLASQLNSEGQDDSSTEASLNCDDQ